jgi:hypothetical protein
MKTIAFILGMIGLAAMSGADCPGLTDTEAFVNLTIGAAMFFGGAGLWLLIKNNGGNEDEQKNCGNRPGNHR